MHAEREHCFGSGRPFSIRVEEELFVVDPFTGRQANSSAAVIERLGDTDGTVAQELHACEVELITGVQRTAGDGAVTPVAGMHVHVGMPDAETAIAVFNRLREQLPLLQALAANSPFRHGRDTGLASPARPPAADPGAPILPHPGCSSFRATLSV